jgi:hypothetical protein
MTDLKIPLIPGASWMFELIHFDVYDSVCCWWWWKGPCFSIRFVSMRLIVRPRCRIIHKVRLVHESDVDCFLRTSVSLLSQSLSIRLQCNIVVY